MIEYLAKYDAQNGATSLREHSIQTAIAANDIMKYYGCDSERVKKNTLIAAIFHDCGKTSQSFQKYLSSSDGEEPSPGHSSAGAVLFSNIVKLSNREDEKIVRDIIEFHHKPYTRSTYLYELYPSIDEIKKVTEYYRDIVSEVEAITGLNLGITFKELNEDFEEDFETILIKENVSFTHCVWDGNNVNVKETISQTSNFVAAFDVVRTADIIASKGENFSPMADNKYIIHKPFHYDEGRYNEQLSYVEKLLSVNGKVDCLKAPTGYGKTAMGLIYTLCTGGYTYWILPTNFLATTTYNSIVSHIKDFSLENEVSVSLLLSGEWKEGKDKENANIIVTNIDNFELGTFKNKRKYMSLQHITRHCIFDEFHSYATMAPLMFSFVTTLRARNYYKNRRTLIMSATPIFHTRFVKKDMCNVVEVENENFNNIPYIIDFMETRNFRCDDRKGKNTLVINATVAQSQDNYENCDVCFHSHFTPEDKDKKILNLLNTKGKNGDSNDSLSTTNIVNEGADISYGSAFIVNPTFNGFLQGGGRVGRFNQNTPKVITVVKDEGQMFVIEQVMKTDGVVKATYDTLKNLCDKHNGVVTYKILSDCLEEFNNKEEVKRYVNNCIQASATDYFKIEFSEGSKIQEATDNKKKVTSDKMTFRGYNKNIYVTIKTDNGEMSSPFTIEEYYFQSGNDNYGRITSNMVTEAIRYIEKENKQKDYFGRNYKHLLKDVSNGDNINRIKRILIDKASSSDTPFPILCDIHYNFETGYR